MIENDFSILRPFILSWNLRNILPNSLILSTEQPTIIGTCLGEYPIDAWGNYFLETPRNEKKMDITGRSNNAVRGGMKPAKCDQRRTINLPIYSHIQDFNVDNLKILFRNWSEIGFSDDIPCLALAVKHRGFYSDNREAQYVTVLTVWNDGVARIISLDWFEGPLEDCITPEWYMETTPLLNLKEALAKMRKIRETTQLVNPIFSIYAIPMCLGNTLNGEVASDSYALWDYGWNYSDYPKFESDLKVLLSKIIDVFYENPQESDVITTRNNQYTLSGSLNGEIDSENVTGIPVSDQIESGFIPTVPFSEHIEEYEDGFESEVEIILNKYGYNNDSLISILLDIQEEFNYLPKDCLITIANKLNIRLIDVYSVATFYKVFSLKPRGKHIINVCFGTACHVRGGRRIVDEIKKRLNIEVGETTEDQQFTLETVRCLGACALGPVMVVNGEYHGKLNAKQVDVILQKYTSQGENS